MKTLISYLLEADQKTYEFKLKFANCDLDNEAMDKIEHALAAFDVGSISKPKHLPPTEGCLDFPSYPDCDVTLLNVVLKYPCTDEQLLNTLIVHGRFMPGSVRVIPAGAPEEIDRVNDAAGVKVYPDGGQALVGQKRMDMLRELETRKFEFAKTEKSDKKTTNDLPQNTRSPVTPINGAK